MNYDEFAFFNQQLSTMLREGLPLEGGLARLCRGMRRGRMRRELEALGADLASGTPLREALARRRLPELYVRLLEVGARGNDLPGVLALVADHYRNLGATWARLRGLLTYPIVVLVLALGLSLFLCLVHYPMVEATMGVHTFREQWMTGRSTPPLLLVLRYGVVIPPVFMGVVLAALVAAAGVRELRRQLQWRLPPFREARVAQTASALAALVRSGCPLDDALALLEAAEAGSPAAADLALWRERLAEGRTRFTDIALGSRVFPGLFVWLVENAGADLAAGLDDAAEVYRGRAAHRTDMLLYGVLPVSVLLLGAMLMLQTVAFGTYVAELITMLGGY